LGLKSQLPHLELFNFVVIETMRSSRKGSSLLLLLLLCLTAATLVHPSSATAVCGGGDCQDVNTRVATNNDDPHDHESTETDVKNVIETTPGDDASVSNDDKLQDGFSSTHLPPRTDENDGDGLILSDRHGEHNSNVTFGTADVDDRDDEQQKMPPSPGWTFIDTIVAIFFVVAALWLIAATLYSIMLIILIRLQARGELDIYDEDLGRFTFCGGRYSLHFGCIVRRYAIQLERDYQRRLHQRFGGSSDVENGEGDPYEPAPIRIMTREERRQAVEVLLGIKPGKSLQTCNTTLTEVRSDKESDDDCDYDCKEHNACRYNKAAGPVSPCRSVNSSNDGPVCSICLDSYSSTDVIFKSHKCTHMFHKDCLMEWLERRSNTVRFIDV
jgi:hypothetical protein